MRTSTIQPQREALFFPGWLVAVTGGGILVLILLFVATAPIGVGNGVDVWWNPDLPLIKGSTHRISSDPVTRVAIQRSGTWIVDNVPIEARALESVIGSAMTRHSSIIGIYPHARAPAESVRRAVQAGINAGATRVEIGVRNAEGEYSTITVDLGRPLPDLPENARVQALVDALVASKN